MLKFGTYYSSSFTTVMDTSSVELLSLGLCAVWSRNSCHSHASSWCAAIFTDNAVHTVFSILCEFL